MIELEKPSVALVPSYLEFIEEMRANGDKFWPSILPAANETAENFVLRLEREITHPADGLVAQTTYWSTREGHVVGRIALRHELNENLKEFGGHIGYEVKPSARRQGIAREMLRLLLLKPKAREIGHLLLTCDPTNIGSNRTIQQNGGVLTGTQFVERVQRETNSYWIDLRG